jgi:hypothetical protein
MTEHRWSRGLLFSLLAALSALLNPGGARAAGTLPTLEQNLSDFEGYYARYEKTKSDDDQGPVALAEKFLTDQIFSLVSDRKIYNEALDRVNRRSGEAPAAMADLGMKLQIRWERDYLTRFYQVEEKRRKLVEIPAEAILVVGGTILGSRHVADPLVVGRYFGAIRKLWAASAALPAAGSAVIGLKLEDLPEPPAARISVALLDRLDYRARAASDASRRKIMARALGILASTECLGVCMRAVATKPTPASAVLILGVLAGSLYIGQSVEELADWNFAWSEEFQLEGDVWTYLYELGEYYRPQKPKSWLDFIGPRKLTKNKFEAVRKLVDAVLRLQAHRDLGILLAEMELEDQTAEIEKKYGADLTSPERKASEARAAATYRVRVRAELQAHRNGSKLNPYFDPWMARHLARSWLGGLGEAPGSSSLRAELQTLVGSWAPPIRRPANDIVGSYIEPPEAMTGGSEAELSAFKGALDRAEAADQVILAKKVGDITRPVSIPWLSRGSEGIFLQIAAWIRSLDDPAIAHVADLLENRAVHFSELVLEVGGGGP